MLTCILRGQTYLHGHNKEHIRQTQQCLSHLQRHNWRVRHLIRHDRHYVFVHCGQVRCVLKGAINICRVCHGFCVRVCNRAYCMLYKAGLFIYLLKHFVAYSE